MGLPIGKIVCATNANDVVHRTIAFGDLAMAPSVATVSPAMDIQLPYNMERLFYFACNADGAVVRRIMGAVESKDPYASSPPPVLAMMDARA